MEQVGQQALAANSDEHRQLRRCRIQLAISGIAVIAFAVWGAIKVILLMALNISSVLQDAGIDELSVIDGIIILSSLLVSIAVLSAIHIFVGLSARSQARGKKKAPVYIAFAIVMALYLAAEVCSSVVGLVAPALTGAETISVDTLLASILFDLGELVAFVDVIVSGVRVRRLTKRLLG